MNTTLVVGVISVILIGILSVVLIRTVTFSSKQISVPKVEHAKIDESWCVGANLERRAGAGGSRGIRITIPRKDNERRRGPFDRPLYRLRNLVERLINRMKQFRRIATRCEKWAVNYAAMGTVAAIYFWL